MLNNKYVVEKQTIFDALNYIQEVTYNIDKFKANHKELNLNYKLKLNFEGDAFKVEIRMINEKKHNT